MRVFRRNLGFRIFVAQTGFGTKSFKWSSLRSSLYRILILSDSQKSFLIFTGTSSCIPTRSRTDVIRRWHDWKRWENSSRWPKCEACGGIVKPDVVLYEEALDGETMQKAAEAIGRADTLIIGGTSLIVYPAAGFIRYFRGEHLVVINKTETKADRSAELVLRTPIGETMEAAMKELSRE